ncbi:MAG: hypothetical protein H6Q13_2889 [Bacteroidetes bacterium]|nr:hypothetical protein [Bacteroidota bacterium]
MLTGTGRTLSRKYKENVKGNKTFQKINGLTEEGSYIYNQNKREEE